MIGRKALPTILSISLLLTLSGCKSKESISVANIKETNSVQTPEENNIKGSALPGVKEKIADSGISKSYNVDDAIKNGYIVMISITTDSSNEVYNINRLDQFIENFNNSKKDKVTIIKYVKNENKIMTHIFEELEYDGQNLTLKGSDYSYPEGEKVKEVPWSTTILYKVVKQTSDKGIRYAIYTKDDNSTGGTLISFEPGSLKN